MATVIAFASGKAGVGKTNIATNLGLSLVAKNTRVCLVDVDTGFTNINSLMGVSPDYTIEHVLNGQKSIDEIIVNLPTGISVVPAASAIKQHTNLDDMQIAKLSSAFKSLENMFDYLLIDAATGMDSNVLDLIASAQYSVIVLTSEPKSHTDSFALLKMLMIRGKKQSIFILINKIDGYHSSQIIFQRFRKAVKSFLKLDVHYLGYLTVDDSLNKAISEHIPVVLSYPSSSVSCGFASLADIIKNKFRNEEDIHVFSRNWSICAQQNKVAIKQVTKASYIRVPSVTKDATEEKNNYLSDVYTLFEQQLLSRQELKEFILTLEAIYEKKYKQSSRDLNSVVALILAEGDEAKIQKLHTAIARSFERQFEKKINNPSEKVQDLMNNDEFSKSDFNRMMESYTAIYQQRFNEKYFAESNMLLTRIQQLLSDED